MNKEISTIAGPSGIDHTQREHRKMKLFALLLTGLFAICAGPALGQSGFSASELPTWFTQPPEDSLYLYATGISDPDLPNAQAREQAEGRASHVLALLRQAKAEKLLKRYSGLEKKVAQETTSLAVKLYLKLAHPPVETVESISLTDGSVAILVRSRRGSEQTPDSTVALVRFDYSTSDSGGVSAFDQNLAFMARDPARKSWSELSTHRDTTRIQGIYYTSALLDSAKFSTETTETFSVDWEEALKRASLSIPAEFEYVYSYGSASVPAEVKSAFPVHIASLTSGLINLIKVIETERTRVQEELLGEDPYSVSPVNSASPATPVTKAISGKRMKATFYDYNLQTLEKDFPQDSSFVSVSKLVSKLSWKHVFLQHQRIQLTGGGWKAQVVLGYPLERIYQDLLREAREKEGWLERVEGTEQLVELERKVRAFGAPVVAITEPDISGGIGPVQRSKIATVRGIAWNEAGIFEVFVNGREAAMGANGEFLAEVKLAVGDNKVVVRAVDKQENATERHFTIVREPDASFIRKK